MRGSCPSLFWICPRHHSLAETVRQELGGGFGSDSSRHCQSETIDESFHGLLLIGHSNPYDVPASSPFPWEYSEFYDSTLDEPLQRFSKGVFVPSVSIHLTSRDSKGSHDV